VDLQPSGLQALEQRLGAGNKTITAKQLRNVGPSITYRLRDAAGQAREYQNYMLPADLGDGVPVFLMGVRDSVQEGFRFLRVPADENREMAGFVRLREALLNPQLSEQAIARYAAQAVDPKRPELAQQLAASARKALELFAAPSAGAMAASPSTGLGDIANYLEKNLPEAEREKASDVLIRLLNGVLFELNQAARARDGLPPLQPSDATRAFMTQAVLSLSDMGVYPAPLAFQLTDFKQVQASVFQVAKAPGQPIVYLGCLLLILGVFAMLYVRERRLWVWVSAQDSGGSQMSLALSSNRKTLDVDQEFERIQAELLTPLTPPTPLMPSPPQSPAPSP
jgi:cytochrome c biogenesis protein